MKVAVSPDAIGEIVCSTALAVELRPVSTASTESPARDTPSTRRLLDGVHRRDVCSTARAVSLHAIDENCVGVIVV